jgi:putative hemolysin
MAVGWLMGIIRCMILTYFELDELINDYEVTTVSGLIMTELSYSKTGRKIDLAKFELEVIDMDGVKIDKVMVKALKV